MRWIYNAQHSSCDKPLTHLHDGLSIFGSLYPGKLGICCNISSNYMAHPKRLCRRSKELFLNEPSKAQWSLYVPHSGHYMYRQFNIQQLYVLPTQCIYVFCVDLRINSDYFPIQNQLTGFYNRDRECLLRGTDWMFIYNSLYITL